jgi:hypothetical protein
MKRGVAGALALCALVFASVALGAASFSDVAGDDNAAPDLTGVTVSETPDGVLTMTVAVANYETLPANSWFNIWFDLDSNQSTGDAGDEALIRYVSDGTVEFYLWDGFTLVERPAAGMSGRYEAGVLTVTTPKSALGTMASFGILAVSSRGQAVGSDELIASDYAPDSGRSAYVSPIQTAFPDPALDQDAAPDITTVRVSDAKDGWISFAISTPNYATLPGESVLALSIDTDNDAASGDEGAEILITSVGGESVLERWDAAAGSWREDTAPTRVRSRNVQNLVTVDIHRSELGNVRRFGFEVVAAAIDTDEGIVLAVDFAPDNLGFFKYALVNGPALRLLTGKTVGRPLQPHAGKRFTVSTPVRRSDTNRPIASGNVSCKVTADGANVRTAGRIRSGRAECTFVVPQGARAVRGSMTVRSGGTAVRANFSFKVR